MERGQLSSSNGDVLVGAGGTLYRLSSELQQLQNGTAPQNPSVPGVPSVLGLTITADGDYLVACFTNRRCAVYNTTTLNTVATGVESESFFSGITVSSVALFTAPSSGMPTFFVGFGEDSTNDRFSEGLLVVLSHETIHLLQVHQSLVRCMADLSMAAMHTS